MKSALGAASTEIEDTIAKVSCRKPEKIRIDVHPYRERTEDSGYCEGIEVTILNQGDEPFPPFRVKLFHPTVKGDAVFDSKVRGYLLSEQERDFQCVAWRNEQRIWPFDRFTVTPDGRRLDDAAIDEYSLQLILEHSRKVLYESRVDGARLARALDLALATPVSKPDFDVNQ